MLDKNYSQHQQIEKGLSLSQSTADKTATLMILRFPLLAFFLLAYGISWLLWAPLWLPSFGVSDLPLLPFHHALGASGPIAAAFIVSAAETGRAGVSGLAMRMVSWQTNWVMVALGAPFLLLFLAVLVAWIIEGEFSLSGLGVSREFPQFSVVGFLLYNLLSFGYGEETGWRGFALPRLQQRYSALTATLLLTVGWAIWHIPLFFYRPGYTSMGIGGIAGWLLSLLTGAILLTWLFNESKGSILVVALFHAAIDVVFTSDIASPFVVNATGVLITVWGVIIVIVSEPQYLSIKMKNNIEIR